MSLIRKRSIGDSANDAVLRQYIEQDRADGYTRDECRRALLGRFEYSEVERAMRRWWPENEGDGTAEQPAAAAPPAAPKPETPTKKEVPYVLRWRRTVCSPAGPKGLKVRGLLLALSLYAGNLNRSDGGGVYPSLRRLAEDAGTSRTVAKRLLAEAEKGGWIRRTQRLRENTHELTSSQYEFLTPQGVGSKVSLGSPAGRRSEGEAQARSGQIERKVGPKQEKGRPPGGPEKSNFLKFDMKSRSDAAPRTRQAAASGGEEHAALPSINHVLH